MASHLNFLNKYRNQKILIAPLNWGLGHASRCVPIIEQLKKHNDVIIGSDGLALDWLRAEFPESTMVKLPSYNVSYQNRPMWINALQQGPGWYRAVRKERAFTKSFVSLHDFDLIISDHRLGMRSPDVKSILLMHQILIAHPNRILRSIATYVQKRMINKFDEVWIPDSDICNKQNLSGELSAPTISPPKSYIGPLSRFFREPTVTKKPSKDFTMAILLSGPEPARTDLETVLYNVIEDCNIENVTFIRGSSSAEIPVLKSTDKIDVIGLANSTVVQSTINNADLIICRSGYSSIMDLVKLDRRALLIPTPGQPEQEYLASRHGATDQFRSINQDQITKEVLFNVLNWVKTSSK